jgi:hypothetical protein
MTDYSKWKIKKSQIEEKQDEYTSVAEWCNESGQYMIVETELYFEVQPIPAPLPPTDEEIRQMRIQYRREHIDDQTAERSRKTANGTWTEDDEAAYLALDAEVTAYIEEHFPYNEE